MPRIRYFSYDYNIWLTKDDNAESDKDDEVDNDDDEDWGRLEGADQTGGNICNIQYTISYNISKI